MHLVCKKKKNVCIVLILFVVPLGTFFLFIIIMKFDILFPCPPTLKLFAHAPSLSWWKSLQTPTLCTKSELAILFSEFQLFPLFMSVGWNGLTPMTFNYCAHCSASFATSFSIMYHCIHCVSTCIEENIDFLFFQYNNYSFHSNHTLTQLGVVQLSIHRAYLDLLCLKSGAFGFRRDDLLSHQLPGFSK